MIRLWAAAALLLGSWPAFADEAAEIVKTARRSGIGKSCRLESAERFCSSEESCLKFCSCACRFDVENWGKVKHETKCPGAPRTGPGMLSYDDPALVALPDLGPYILDAKGQRATHAVADALARLADHLAKDADMTQERYRYKVRVVDCYRPAVGDPRIGNGDTERECGLILAADYMLKKDLTAEDEAKWKVNRDPRKKGLTWPGATPHSAGLACDLVLVDKHGDDSFDWRAGIQDPEHPVPHSSIDPKLASSLLDKAVTGPDVGGKRLNYEAWHYEWGGPDEGRCVHPDCADRHWPPSGHP